MAIILSRVENEIDRVESVATGKQYWGEGWGRGGYVVMQGNLKSLRASATTNFDVPRWRAALLKLLREEIIGRFDAVAHSVKHVTASLLGSERTSCNFLDLYRQG